MIDLLKTVIKHCATGIDGATYDPARVIGYGSAVLLVAAFSFNSIYAAVARGTWDAQSFGIGAASLLAGVAAAGAGVAVKSKTEPTS